MNAEGTISIFATKRQTYVNTGRYHLNGNQMTRLNLLCIYYTYTRILVIIKC